MDSQMMELVSSEDIKSELQQLGLDIDDDLVIERMKNLCIVFNISCEKLVESYYSYQLKKKIKGLPSVAHLEQFEENVLRKDYVSENNLSLKKVDDLIPTSVKKDEDEVMAIDEMLPSTSKVTSSDIVVEKEDEEEPKDGEEEKTETATEEPSAGGDDGSVLLKLVSCYFGDSLQESDWKTKDSFEHKIEHYTHGYNLKGNYKILDMRIQDFGEMMDNLIDDFQGELSDKLPSDANFGNIALESAASVYFCGRVTKEILNARMNSHSILLEGNGDEKRRIKLNIDDLKECGFFPGQLVAVKATNTGDELKVFELVDPLMSLPPIPTTQLGFKTLDIMIACGPFGGNHSAIKLNENIAHNQPHVVILTGPFVVCNDAKDDISENFEHNLIKSILKITELTQVVVVPSPNDFFCTNVFPTFCHPKVADKRVHYMPNPCLVDISGCVIGVSTVDIILDMLKEEFSKSSEVGERMKRLHQHLLCQKSFYPLFPPSTSINVDYMQYQHVRMPVRPHVLILPSDTKNFCKSINGTVCVNPGKVSKGSVSRMKIQCPNDGFSGSIDTLTSVEVFRLA